MQGQMEKFGRNFFYVREFKKQYDNYWTNTDSRYYFTVEHREHEFEYKKTVKGVFWFVLLGVAVLGGLALALYFCCRRRRRQDGETASSDEATEIKANLLPKPSES